MTRTIGAGLPALAAAEPTRPALVCDDTVLTREMLTARIATRAALLAQRSAPGAPIALALGNGPELVDAFFACAIGGRQALVYDPAWPAPYRAAIDAALAPAITLETLPDLALSTPAPFPPPPAPDAPFYVGFTSGSTGLPKGYRRSHRSWIDSFKVSAAAFGLGEQDVVLAPGGLAASLHLYGVVHALHGGATAVMMRQFHPRRALRLIARHGVTAIYATPTQLQMLIEAGGGERLPTVRLILISGAKWRAETRAATLALFPKAGIAEFYGASETSFITLAHPNEAVPAGSVGRAAPGVTLRIRDAAGRDLPAGEAGAIWVKSTMLFDDYACGHAPETRREGGFLTIGDHGRLDEAGFLYLHGREKRMLVTSGLNVYPEEVESVLVSLPGIAEAAVFGLPDSLRGVELVAVLRGTFDEPALRAACRALLPAAKIPRRFLRLEEWPRTSGGKADLRALEAVAREKFTR
ncbi:class I adenylate-forming enzyme family protein [Ancylobacter polymorphus]|uniref:Long-chain acyl-CoA synthetase n=1 Tax=Ancylobacter polymorphus TaxID=223390 RepID=A0ABU0BA86_9HYPH|nr:AMP-binding protein [Ancylobacter polymorphus]MDQ0302748.1 long-chain acyl-CoA synthetase [Ancylobacter polymorphus]